MSTPTLHQLRILAAVADAGGVSRAAERLHLTQPTLSIQLRQLADTVGAPLFDTVGRRLVLTDAGHEVLRTAHDIGTALENLRSRLAARRGVQSGRLELAAVTTAEYFLPRLMGQFQQAHPGVEVALRVANRADILQRIADHRDDAYLMTRPPDDPALRSEAVGRNPLLVVGAPDHPWVGRRRIPTRELATVPFVVREEGSGTRLWTDDWLRGRGITVRTRLELGSNEAVKQAVRGGFGVAVLSAHAVAIELEHGLMAALDVAGFPLPARWHLVTRAGRVLSPVVAAFRVELKRWAMPDVVRGLGVAAKRRQ
jgi:LysR family transcriptional regulator, low CO2-responsive transcriptional regulator